MFQRTRVATAALALTLGLPAAALAQETVTTTTTTTSSVPNLTQVLDASGVTLNGHLDASYDIANTDAIANVPFYQNPNNFTLHQAELVVAKLPAEGFGGKVDVLAGSDARILNSVGQYAHNSYFNLTQAFVQYAHGPFSVIAGKYTSLAGYEVIDSSANPNATNSILFTIVPFIHTGVRGAYKLGNNTFTLGVNNSQSFFDEDTNQQKTVEAAYGLTVNPNWNLALTGYVGKEPTLSNDANTPTLVKDETRATLDFVTNYKVTPDITLGANVDYVRQNLDIGKANATGVALYFNDHFLPNMRVAARAEYLKVKSNGSDGSVAEITGTYGYSPVASTELIAEVRYDKADKDARGVYITDASAPASENDDQILGTLKVIYKF